MGWAIAGVFALVACLAGPVMSDVEHPRYALVERHDDIELRDYPPLVVAETELGGERRAAIDGGFRIVADYIFGNNVAAQKVAMTAPVTQQAIAAIASTAPPIRQTTDLRWRVRFIMPAGYTLATLPQPNNRAVVLRAIGARRYAVIRFSGSADEQSLQRHTAQLRAFLDARHLQSAEAPTFAFYDPPWTLPFLRRNEVMLALPEGGPAAGGISRA